MRYRFLLLLALALPAFGCGGTVLSGPGDDGGVTDAAAKEGAAPTQKDAAIQPDASPGDASSAPDATSEGGTAVACNTLANTAMPVTVQQLAEDPPAPLGGTVADGKYDLTGVAIYTGPDGPSGSTGSAQTTIEISGSTIEVSSTGEPPTRTTSLSTSGTTFTSTDTCPDSVVSTGSFTATSTTFSIFLDGGTDDAGARTVVETFTRE
jgi:hypothetical protein